MIIDHNFHSMIMVFIDNIFHTYSVHDPYLVKDHHMFIIRFLLLLLHEDDLRCIFSILFHIEI